MVPICYLTQQQKTSTSPALSTKPVEGYIGRRPSLKLDHYLLAAARFRDQLGLLLNESFAGLLTIGGYLNHIYTLWQTANVNGSIVCLAA